MSNELVVGVAAFAFISACASPSSSRSPLGNAELGVGPPGVDAAQPDLANPDVDEDGLNDSDELTWARAYLPYLSLSPSENCPTGGLLVRVSPHPQRNGFVHILYDFLYNEDCGLSGHDGDDEVFAITIDPSQPPPAGIVAMTAISHQGTACEHDSSCGRCSGQTACQTLPLNGVSWPAVWPSENKHGNYVDRTAECILLDCLDSCVDATAATVPEIVNAGEPGHPMVDDLTTEGFITAANGWTHMELFHFDPWKSGKFGGAGDVSLDLVDPSFDTPACP